MLWSVALVFLLPTALDAATPIAPQALDDFEAKVRPLLIAKCYECHSLEAGKSKGGLLLDSKAGLQKGGETGPALDAVIPEKSLLLAAIRWEQKELQMPPKERLSREEVHILETWVRQGAPDPREAQPAGHAAKPSRLETAKSHWAFQPRRRAEAPEVQQAAWIRTPVDRFILAALEEKNLTPAPPADPRTLVRRVYLDLIGLPPTPGEVESFINDPSEAAFATLVDKLLASQHYGERWGRHWLDLARYADTSGLHNDLDRPQAWRYRDYVIRSFNEDKPYARFIAEQLAGDEVEGANEESLVATGFCRNGPTNDDNMGNNKEQYRLDELDDVISTTSSVFLGLTVGCARCHDHKYDPVTSADYYSLLAVFNGTEKLGVPGDTKNKAEANTAKRIEVQALVETKSRVRPTFLLRRGNLSTPGAEVPPGAPRFLTPIALEFPTPPANSKSSLRRLTFAQWLGAPENPLTWRVHANRVWQHFMGKGLVLSSSNFGLSGSAPSHPALLDYLANQLVANGGRLKPLHREILLSSTYRQACTHSETAAAVDPENTLLWKMNRRRMEAEVLRDSILSVCGSLNPAMGGPGIKPRIRPELLDASQRNKWPVIDQEGPEHWRRSVYIYSKRQLLMPFLELFDAPTTTESLPSRAQSVVPTQALLLLNDEFVEQQARKIARIVLQETAPGKTASLIQRILSKPPSAIALQQAESFLTTRRMDFLRDGLESSAAAEMAFSDLAHVLLNASEFLYIE